MGFLQELPDYLLFKDPTQNLKTALEQDNSKGFSPQLLPSTVVPSEFLVSFTLEHHSPEHMDFILRVIGKSYLPRMPVGQNFR